VFCRYTRDHDKRNIAEKLLKKLHELSEDALSSYLGFFLQDGTYLDIANMTTGTYYGFTKE